jgi:membrane protease YdiL (CAAX protease family)
MTGVTPASVAALVLELIPAAGFSCAAEAISDRVGKWAPGLRIALAAFAVVPYTLVSVAQHIFSWRWFVLYAFLPVAIAWLLEHAAAADPERRGNWRDAFILLLLGLAVDLRWFDSAWPVGQRALNELLLVDMGLYGFLAVRRLDGVGFDFHLQWSDLKSGLRELLFFTPIVLLLGLALGFIHPHTNLPAVWRAGLTWIGIFLFIAVPEELYFRGWLQNFLERRVGRVAALVIASMLFGLSHFNKRSAHFNWRYVLLATIAGIFYGRAWRERRRIPASAITHACVDWIWSWWF